MAYEIINIPLSSGSKTFNTDDLNKFCANKKIIERKIEFFQQDGSAFWSVFIEYESILEPTGRETEGLTEAGRVCYEELRRWRKETAEKEGIPPFVIAKNSHFVEIVNKEIATLEALKQINGFGKKKMEKLRALMQISVNKKYIFLKQYEHISREINEAGKMIGVWIKSCAE